MKSDHELLAAFVRDGCESAFAELVERHLNLVYAAAWRESNGDASMAQDVAQIVFCDLARKAKSLPRDVILAGWLHRATHFAVAKTIRTERRRRAREEKAMAMQAPSSQPSSSWQLLQPVLDAAIEELNAQDRHAVLLRFFEQQSLESVGEAMGVSSGAAQKRVARALDKLRRSFARRGIVLSTSALATVLTAKVIQAAPAELLSAVTTASLATATPAQAAAGAGAWFLMTTKKFKLAAATLILLLLGGGSVGIMHVFSSPDLDRFKPVDLTYVYNGSLDTCWLPGWDPDNHLGNLPAGRQVFNGVLFDVGGVVQLQGQAWESRGYDFPERVDGIWVGKVCRKIHILHANSAFGDPQETQVASLVLHYQDGGAAQIEILQGVHLLDWWKWSPHDVVLDPQTFVAWSGQNPVTARQRISARIFLTTFENPEPERKVETIDYVSAMAGSAPFMVALTVEP